MQPLQILLNYGIVISVIAGISINKMGSIINNPLHDITNVISLLQKRN